MHGTKRDVIIMIFAAIVSPCHRVTVSPRLDMLSSTIEICLGV